MKKYTLLFLLPFLFACQSTPPVQQKVACSGILDDMHMTTTLFSKADALYKQIITTSIPYASMGISKKRATSLAHRHQQEYHNYAGITFAYTIDARQLTQSIALDFTKVQVKDLKTLGFQTSDNTTYSLSKAVSLYEQQGFDCKVRP